MVKISSRFISIENPKFPSKRLFNSEKVSEIKYRRRSISCSLQLEGGNSISSPTPTILLRRLISENSSFENKLSFLSYPDAGSNNNVIDIDFPSDFMNSSLNLEICGHSHGIVCLSDIQNFSKDIFLCNPETKKFRQLPPSTFKLIDDNVDLPDPRFQCFTTLVGFGYDLESDDFKVVRLVSFGTIRRCARYGGDVYNFDIGVEVYDLSTDRWRRIETASLFPIVGKFRHENVFLRFITDGGFGFWYQFSNSELKRPVIVSFNMSQEVFQLTPSPPVCTCPVISFEPRITLSFLVRNGSMFLFDYEDSNECFMWEIEKKNDESKRVSWSELITFPSLGIRKPLVFLNSDELLMETKKWDLVIYNLKTRKIKHLEKDVTGLPYSFQAFVFEKSLLSVKAGTRLTS